MASFATVTDVEDYKKLIASSPKVVTCGISDTCSHCAIMEPIITEMKDKYQNITFVKIEIHEHKDIAYYIKLSGTPMFTFSLNGNTIKELSMAGSKIDLFKDNVDKLSKM